MGEVHSHLSLSTPMPTSITNAGHRFLQPRVNSGSSLRRGFSPGTSPSIATVTASSASSCSSTASFAYQSVLPIGVESSGVTLPVQRIIEGLPVVTLPGIVAHEVHTMSIKYRVGKLYLKYYSFVSQSS